eukprot:Lithocolla_globosa_v1_NODE_1295_length_2694_cov_12.905646.p1 type:complete len:604 gc:universal NODE_1295_length_2694_cov_12.905646:614-2425(+)
MKASLDRLLSNKSYRDDYFIPNASTDGNLRDICDGSNFKEHPIFSQHPDAAQVILYFDEFEVTNPLSGKVHKLGIFYTQNANVSIHHRSKLDMIEVVAVAKTEDLKSHKQAVSCLLENFVSTMQQLGSQEGLYLKGADLTIWGALIVFAGDTPASAYIGGFKEGVGLAFRKCRTCMGIESQMSDYFFESDFTNRTLDQHYKQCELLEGTNSNFWSITFGIVCLSVLDKCPYFNLTTMMPHDIAHVILEGFYSDELVLFLNYCLKEKEYFTIDQFSIALKNFPLSSHENGNRPCPLRKKAWEDGKKIVKNNASQTWMLSRMLPFILQDFVPDNDNHWICLKAHTAILHMTMKQSYDHVSIDILNETVAYHHNLFRQIYKKNITPKGHYYVHFGSSILRNGPLRRVWTLRFEGKHKFMKQFGTKSNWINLPYTLSTRHQLHVCNKFLKLAPDHHPDVLGPKFYPIGKIKSPSSAVIERLAEAFGMSFADVELENIQVLSKLLFWGTEFRPGTVSKKLSEQDDLPSYFVIEDIIVFRGRYYFDGTELRTTFDEDMLAMLIDTRGVRSIHLASCFDSLTATTLWRDKSNPPLLYVSDKNHYPRFEFN